MCISIYLLTLSISLIIKEVLPLKALFICLAYIIPMTVMYLITDYKEGEVYYHGRNHKNRNAYKNL